MRLIRVARALRAVVVPAVVAALVAFPLGVLASHSFSDVPTTHPFHADIAALKDSGVSPTGCGGGRFCPDDFVTRGQMAAFLNRLGALGPGKVPVANADRLDGLDSTDFASSLSVAGYNYNNNGDSNALIGLTNSGASMASVTLQAPAAGYAWVTGKVATFISHTSGTFDNVICKLSKTSGEVSTPSFGVGLVRIPATYPTSTNAVDTVEITRVFSVAAGANTFHLNCYESSSTLNASILLPEITGLFVATRYGTGPLPAVHASGGVNRTTD